MTIKGVLTSLKERVFDRPKNREPSHGVNGGRPKSFKGDPYSIGDLTIFLGHMTDGVLLVDGEGRVIFINESARRLLRIGDIPQKNIRGRHLIEIIRSKRLIDTLNRLGGGPLEEPQKIDLPTGEVINVWIIPTQRSLVCLVLKPNGEDGEDESTFDTFPIQDAAHQFKTPLSAIKGYAETLLETPGISNEAREEFLRAILRNCLKMERLTKSLLLLSRLKKEELQRGFSRFDLADLLKDVISTLMPSIESKYIRLKFESLSNGLSLKGDRELMSVAILNVIENAIEYSDRGGTVEVVLGMIEEACSGQKEASLIVRDHGPGIPSDELDKIFTRFYRARELQKRYPGGTGLGLSITKEILSIHEASIVVESQWGKGTSVTMRFPVETD